MKSEGAGNTDTGLTLPRDCTFTVSDWKALAPHWYPVAFCHEVKDRPYAARWLDERLVICRSLFG
jgi:hypothetical protein